MSKDLVPDVAVASDVDFAPFVDGLPHPADVGIRQVVPIGSVLVDVGLRHDALGDAALR